MWFVSISLSLTLLWVFRKRKQSETRHQSETIRSQFAGKRVVVFGRLSSLSEQRSESVRCVAPIRRPTPLAVQMNDVRLQNAEKKRNKLPRTSKRVKPTVNYFIQTL
ncbi:unnamed protein product, partial [Ectocarpus sp. 12 AP-2014]